MKPSYFDAPGTLIESDDLEIQKARNLALNLNVKGIMFAKLVECRKNSQIETVVFDLDVEVPQVRCHPIHPRERIAVTFSESDDIIPIIHALRKNFPRVPHLNLHLQEYPRNLCLYNESYENIKRRWTPSRFVRDIRNWLALTARGELHQNDQSLEPILVDFVGHIVIPHNILGADDTVEPLFLQNVRQDENGKHFLIAQARRPQDKVGDIVASVHRCQPQTHGVIHRRPQTLTDLVAMTESIGLDLIAELRDRLRDWQTNNNTLLDSHILLVILFPKKRYDDGEVEAIDVWTFFLGDATQGEHDGDLLIRDLGIRIGLWDITDNKIGLLITPDTSKRGEDVGLNVLNAVYNLDRSMAAILNGSSEVNDMNVTAVGVGALGSQVIMNLARAGFGTWTLIDNDTLMPHNVARHALGGSFVGCNKAEAVALLANTIIKEANLFCALPVNVLSPGDRDEDLSQAFGEADAILDMSTSVSVARMLASNLKSTARRLSLFMSPSGYDLVLLAEDRERKFALDALEMQYYRAIVSDYRLVGHLDLSEGQHRYAQSCRDITSTLPQHMVALHSGQGARAVRDTLSGTEAAMVVWRASDNGSVQRVDMTPAAVLRQKVNSWTVVTDNDLFTKLSALRDSKLPNETGGVLMGSFDLERLILYIVDALPSPPDSEEWPTLYIRGSQDLAETVDALTKKTQGMLEYIGEWHSHPEGSSPTASHDDFNVFEWLANLMQEDGLPAVMIIVGDLGCTSCYVGEILKETILQSRAIP